MPNARDRITVHLRVTGQPDVIDWRGRKVIVTPESVVLTYQPGHDSPVSAMVTGPARPAPGIRDFSGEMTISFYSEWPEPWPQWLRDLGAAHTPPNLT